LLTEFPQTGAECLNLERAFLGLERRLILGALATASDGKAEAARMLGIGERTLWTKLKNTTSEE
jgi:DNA-binding NtrC family response regulator